MRDAQAALSKKERIKTTAEEIGCFERSGAYHLNVTPMKRIYVKSNTC
jgi:hypothetical protein